MCGVLLYSPVRQQDQVSASRMREQPEDLIAGLEWWSREGPIDARRSPSDQPQPSASRRSSKLAYFAYAPRPGCAPLATFALSPT